MASRLLDIVDFSCERDDRLLINALNLSINSGEILQIEGSNGSGKTTLLRALAGLSEDFDGQLMWVGQPLKQVRHEYLSGMLYLGHATAVKATLTPLENLRWYGALQGGVDDQRILAALDKVNLSGYEQVRCFQLSAGQQRRVALARLFLRDCALWLLDEPFTAIDKQGVAELESWIAEFADQGGAVILTTHHQLSMARSLIKINLDTLHAAA